MLRTRKCQGMSVFVLFVFNIISQLHNLGSQGNTDNRESLVKNIMFPNSQLRTRSQSLALVLVSIFIDHDDRTTFLPEYPETEPE